MQRPLLFDRNFDNYLSEFESYNLLMENFLIKEFLKAEKEWNFDEFNLEENIDEFLSQSKNVFEHTSFYPQSFRKSFLVQIFSIFEKELKEICLYHHFEKKTDFSIKDLSGNSDIEKAKLYLQKSCKIDLKKLNPDLEFLETIRKIRNLIVHSQGEIDQTHRDWNQLSNFIKSNKNMLGFSNAEEYLSKREFEELYEKKEILIIDINDSELINKLILSLRNFFKNLISELEIK